MTTRGLTAVLRAGRVPAVLAALVVAAGCGSGGTGGGGAGPTPSSGTPPAGPTATASSAVPTSAPEAAPSLRNLTWVSAQHGWALADRACGSGRCAVVLETTDGGAHWQTLPAPPAGSAQGGTACPDDACVSAIRFATPTVGYLFGPAMLTTTDAGRSWHREGGPNVETLTAAGDAVYRVVYDHTGCPGPCDPRLEVAAPGSSSWRTAIAHVQTPGRSGSAEVVASGRTLLLAAYGSLAGPVSAEAVVYRSTDAGATWERVGDPCSGRGNGEHDLIALTAAPGGFFAGLCSPHGAPGGFVVTSTDGGAGWSAAGALPDSPMVRLLAAASPTRLAVATGPTSGSGPFTAALLVSADAGHHWATAATDPQQLTDAVPAWLGFETATVGRWVSAPDHVWSTGDGGAQWTRSRFP